MSVGLRLLRQCFRAIDSGDGESALYRIAPFVLPLLVMHEIHSLLCPVHPLQLLNIPLSPQHHHGEVCVWDYTDVSSLCLFHSSIRRSPPWSLSQATGRTGFGCDICDVNLVDSRSYHPVQSSLFRLLLSILMNTSPRDITSRGVNMHGPMKIGVYKGYTS